MSYEKKVLDATDKIVDAIYYEEGRLAIINKYGSFLNDEEKTQATQLITKQRVNLDRLFEIYKNELFPLMEAICDMGTEMAPLVEKLVSAEMIAKQMGFQQDVAESKSSVEPIMTSPTVSTDTSADSEKVTSESPVETDETVSENVPFDPNAALNSGADAVNAPVSAEDGVMTGSEIVPLNGSANSLENTKSQEAVVNEGTVPEFVVSDGTEAVSGQIVGEENVVQESAPSVEQPEEEAVITQVNDASVSSEETPTIETQGFVLSPIDEGVSLVPTVEEAKAAEESATVAEQQLQAIDLMKTNIANSPVLSNDEKKEEIEKYTKITEGAVRAILVTKAQYERLSTSRKTQKELLKGEQVSVVSEGTIDGVVTPPDITSGENSTSIPEVVDAVVLPTIGDLPASEVKEDNSTEGGFLPMINEETGNSGVVNPEGLATEVTPEVVLPTIDVAGTSTNTATETPVNQSGPNELQAMIEQANALYKEGKVAEAQALFDKVGAINKEMQSANGTQVDEASVLVKK